MMDIYPTRPLIHENLFEINGQGKSECYEIRNDPARKLTALEPNILPDIRHCAVDGFAGKLSHELVFCRMPLARQRFSTNVDLRGIFSIVFCLRIPAVVVRMQIEKQEEAVLSNDMDQQVLHNMIELIVLCQRAIEQRLRKRFIPDV